MRHLRKYLQQVGLVSTLLLAGVLGGLMVPLPSEAQTVPTVKFKVDSTEYTLTLTSIACPTGYRLCYNLPVGNTTPVYSGTNANSITRSYTIRNSPNTTARLLVKDINGRDELILTGVQFVPTTTSWGAAAIGRPCTTAEVTAQTCTATILGEFHDLRVIITHKFDSVPNPVGTQLCTEATKTTCNPALFAIGIGGYFVPGPTPTASTAGNFIKWTGKGTFKASAIGGPGEVNLLGVAPRTVNLTELKFQQSDKATSTASATFNLAQTGTVNNVVATGYPQYLCSNGLTCTPTVTVTMTARMYGPDTLATTNSDETIGGSCKVGQNEADPDPLSFGILDSNLPKIIKIILHKLAFLLSLLDKDKDEVCPRTDQFQRFFAVRGFLNWVAGTLVGAVPGTESPEGEFRVCADPDGCGTETATIKIIKNTVWQYPDCCDHYGTFPNGTFNFAIYNGEEIPIATPQIEITDGNGTGMAEVVEVEPGHYTVTETNDGDGEDSQWNQGPYSCISDGSGSIDGGSIDLGPGDTVTCTFNNIDGSD